MTASGIGLPFDEARRSHSTGRFIPRRSHTTGPVNQEYPLLRRFGKVSLVTAYLSICAIYRDEAPYLREWIEFHGLGGVERFFLYDNLSEDDHLSALAPYLEDGTVVLREWPAFPGQLEAYAHCL